MTPETRDTWVLVSLGVMALATLVQAAMLVALTRAAQRSALRLAAVEGELREQLRQGVAHLQHVANDVNVLAHRAQRQVDRVERVLDVSAQGARMLVDTAGRALLPSLRLVALYKGLMRGIEVYRARRA
jgi:hypothetical protein